MVDSGSWTTEIRESARPTTPASVQKELVDAALELLKLTSWAPCSSVVQTSRNRLYSAVRAVQELGPQLRKP